MTHSCFYVLEWDATRLFVKNALSRTRLSAKIEADHVIFVRPKVAPCAAALSFMPVEVMAPPSPSRARRMSRVPDAPTTCTEVVLLCVTKQSMFRAFAVHTGAAKGERWVAPSPQDELRSCSVLLPDGSPLEV
jgi:hypothetical protein